jgi:hypothetical protein
MASYVLRSMSYSAKLNSTKTGDVNPSRYAGGPPTEFGTFFPEELSKFQNMTSNVLDNPVWHLDGGTDVSDPAKKGYLQFDLFNSVSGIQFNLIMKINSQKIVKVEVVYDDIRVLLVDNDSVSPEEVVNMFNWDAFRVFDKMIECTANKGVQAQIAKKKSEIEAVYLGSADGKPIPSISVPNPLFSSKVLKNTENWILKNIQLIADEWNKKNG